MIDEKLLEMLCCPLDKQPLRFANEEELVLLNKKIELGALVNKTGEKIANTLKNALVTEDGLRFYPVIEGIPVLLVYESITPEV
ncbi:MAG: hypothetical protein GX801_00290 [Fibrobacter sp.]|nr:hypothetical protein [Fibrobacter sp.]